MPSPQIETTETAFRKPKTICAEAWRWWAVRCASGQSFRVCDDLDAQGFATLAPAARTIFIRYGRKIEREYPVFGAYVFVGALPGMGVFKRTHEKIEAVLGDSRGPISIRGQAIKPIVELEAEGFWSPRGDVATEFKRGDMVRICAAKGADLVGEFDSFPSEIRALVWVSMFGARRLVPVDACKLEPA